MAMSTMRVLSNWAERSRPPTRRLLASVGLALLAALSSLALLGGSGVLVVRATGGGGLAALGGLLIAIELMAFLRAPLRLSERLSAHRVALRSMIQWRLWLYDGIARQPAGTLTISSGELLDRSIDDVDALQDLYVRLALPLLSVVVAGLAASIWIALVLPLAGLVMLVMVTLGIVVALLVGRRADQDQIAAAAARGHLAGRVADLVAGMTELAMVDGTAGAMAGVEAAAHRRSRILVRQAWRQGLGGAGEVLVVGAGIIAVTLLAGQSVASGSIGGAAAAGVVLLAVAGLEPLPGLIAAALRAPEVAASARRLEEIEAMATPVVAVPATEVWPPSPVTISIEGLRVTLPGRGHPILDGASLELPPGEHIALLGASGSGKSTLAAVLLGFVPPTAGSVHIGGTALGAICADDIIGHVALLDQSPALFGGTIRDALRLGAPSASDTELRDVLATCQLVEVVEGVGGLDAVLAEQGASLSGGQQQRLALARALLRRPDLLILDEPTVGLDPDQAHEVLTLALAAAGSATVLLITHDVHEALRCQRIGWLSGGQIRLLGPDEVAALR